MFLKFTVSKRQVLHKALMALARCCLLSLTTIFGSLYRLCLSGIGSYEQFGVSRQGGGVAVSIWQGMSQ